MITLKYSLTLKEIFRSYFVSLKALPKLWAVLSKRISTLENLAITRFFFQ